MRQSSSFVMQALGVLRLALMVTVLSSAVWGGEPQKAEAQARKIAAEMKDYVFRAESWLKEIQPDVGKAVRLQLFKEHTYCFIVSLPPSSKAELDAAVLNFEGKVVSKPLSSPEPGRVMMLQIKPPQTGTYVVAIRQAVAESKPVPCCLLTGYK
jgi:hypothetical protein